jgi:archaellum biogenesis protein FlaJ (TadC family)
MEGVQIDWLVVVVAAILNMVIGFLWYSKWLFGPAWMKLSKHTAKDMKTNGKTMILGFIVSVVIAFFLAVFEGYLGVTTVTDGMFVGFLLWLGFVATTQISGYLWCKKSFRLFLINTGCKLLSYLVMSGLIGA